MAKNVQASLEALLFMSGDALSYTHLQKNLEINEESLMQAILELQENLRDTDRGLVLIDDGKNVRLGVKNEYVNLVENFFKRELQSELSKASLQVLTLVAYLAPVARVEIDAVRGVNSSFTLRNLALRGLVERKGNPDDSRGYIYEPSMEFLTTLGIENTRRLPEYQKLRNDKRLAVLLGKENSLIETPLEDAHEKT